MNSAVHLSAIDVMTITVGITRDEVRMTEVPLHDSFCDVLMRERKTKPATRGFAKRYAVLAIDRNRALEGVFVMLRILVSGADAFLPKPLNHTIGNLLLLAIEHFDVYQPLFRQQFDSGVSEG